VVIIGVLRCRPEAWREGMPGRGISKEGRMSLKGVRTGVCNKDVFLRLGAEGGVGGRYWGRC
jgi:hypothetical protein